MTGTAIIDQIDPYRKWRETSLELGTSLSTKIATDYNYATTPWIRFVLAAESKWPHDMANTERAVE